MDANDNIQFKFVSLNQEKKMNHGASGKETLSSRVYVVLRGTVCQWFHFSILRQVLLETRSVAHRISWSRCRRTALNFAEVRRSVPQVPCSGSRNEMQYCTASIQRLSQERPYPTLSDYRLFVEGFFLAEKWFHHMGKEYRNAHQESREPSESATILRRA